MSTPHLAIPAVPLDEKHALEKINLLYAQRQLESGIHALDLAWIGVCREFNDAQGYKEIGEALQKAAAAIWEANVAYRLALLTSQADDEDVIRPPTEADDAQLLRDPKADEIGGAA